MSATVRTEPKQMSQDDMGAMTVQEFCKKYKRSKTAVYADINAGRLKARKASPGPRGKTILLHPDIREWERTLPLVGSQ